MSIKSNHTLVIDCIFVVAESPTNGLKHSLKYLKTLQYEVSLDPEANITLARSCEIAYRPMFLYHPLFL